MLSHVVFRTQHDYSTLTVTVIVVICAISAQEEAKSNFNIDEEGTLQEPLLIENLLGMIASEDEKLFFCTDTWRFPMLQGMSDIKRQMGRINQTLTVIKTQNYKRSKKEEDIKLVGGSSRLYDSKLEEEIGVHITFHWTFV